MIVRSLISSITSFGAIRYFVPRCWQATYMYRPGLLADTDRQEFVQTMTTKDLTVWEHMMYWMPPQIVDDTKITTNDHTKTNRTTSAGRECASAVLTTRLPSRTSCTWPMDRRDGPVHGVPKCEKLAEHNFNISPPGPRLGKPWFIDNRLNTLTYSPTLAEIRIWSSDRSISASHRSAGPSIKHLNARYVDRCNPSWHS
jgi:hypothetical protein